MGAWKKREQLLLTRSSCPFALAATRGEVPFSCALTFAPLFSRLAAAMSASIEITIGTLVLLFVLLKNLDPPELFIALFHPKNQFKINE
tara:strand:- start:344 stop:610 length:267 start_codon:yes stop_codon:yes gene_type:complete